MRIFLTDSGGVHKETYFYKKPGLVLMETTGGSKFVKSGWITLVGLDSDKIIKEINSVKSPHKCELLYGDDNASNKIWHRLIYKETIKIYEDT